MKHCAETHKLGSGCLFRKYERIIKKRYSGTQIASMKAVKLNQQPILNFQENDMKLICTLQAIEESFSAAAFAEENEHQAAREMLRRQDGERKGQLRAAAVISDEYRREMPPAI